MTGPSSNSPYGSGRYQHTSISAAPPELALTLGAATQVWLDPQSELVKRCRWIAFAGTAVGSGCLIYDLGRPARFLNMLRVFRPTSPMNVGSWVLAAAGSFAGLAAITFGAGRKIRFIGNAAGIAGGIAGLPLAGYTGVLLANTAVPLWQQGRRVLPLLFMASGMSSLGAILDLMELAPRERRIARAFGLAGQTAELAVMTALHLEAEHLPQTTKPLKQGFSGFLWKTAAVLGAASLALTLWPGENHKRRVAAGVCGTAGALSLRFAALQAGRASSRDPRAVFSQQQQSSTGVER
jgi:formate-dependent nitrite reductase membrane component NrfD